MSEISQTRGPGKRSKAAPAAKPPGKTNARPGADSSISPRSRRVRFAPNPAPPTVELASIDRAGLELLRHRALLDAVAALKFPYPAERFAGRGIVICGGGTKYFPCVYVLVRLLRYLGCTLPIEVWHLGGREMSAAMRGLLAAHGADCRDAQAERRVHPVRRLSGWELKCFAVLHCRFAEAMLLDADNCPVRDPAFLFNTPESCSTRNSL